MSLLLLLLLRQRAKIVLLRQYLRAVTSPFESIGTEGRCRDTRWTVNVRHRKGSTSQAQVGRYPSSYILYELKLTSLVVFVMPFDDPLAMPSHQGPWVSKKVICDFSKGLGQARVTRRYI